MDDFILLRRNVEATQIPSGQLVHLPEGTPVSITQSLGGTFTVHASPGGLYRIGAADADALGKEAPEVAQVTSGPFSEELLWGALREVYDPEIPVNIVDLGLVYSLRAEPVEGEESRRVTVEMTLTAPGCGMGPSLAADARESKFPLLLVRDLLRHAALCGLGDPHGCSLLCGRGRASAGSVSRVPGVQHDGLRHRGPERAADLPRAAEIPGCCLDLGVRFQREDGFYLDGGEG